MKTTRPLGLGLALILAAGHILDGVESTRVLHDWWSDASKGKITNPLPPAPSLPKLPNLPAKLDPVKGAQQIGRQVGNAVSGSSGGTSFSGGGGIRTPSIPTPALPKVPTPSLPKLPTPSLPSTPKLANVPAKVDPVKAATQLGKQVGNPFDGGSGGAVQQGLQTINTNWQAAQKQATQIQKTVDNLQAQGAKAQETWDQLKAKGAKAQETWDAIKAEGTKFGDDPEGYVWQGVKREVTSKAQDAITKALPKCSCSDFETDKWHQRHALEKRFCHQQPCSLNGGCCGGVRYAKQEGGEEALQIGAESVAACVACTGGCAACGAAAAATAIQEELEAQLKSIVKALTDTVSDIANAGENMAGNLENELRDAISTLAAKVTGGSGVNLGDMQNDAASAMPLKSMPKCRFAIEPGKFTFHSRTCVYCCNCVKNLDAVQFYLAWRLDCR